MTPDIRLAAQSNPCWLQAIRGLVRCYLNNFDIDPDKVDDIVLALDEACANVIRHSYLDRRDQPIRLALAADADNITFLLEDEGIPAPADKIRPCVMDNPERKNLHPGGLGVKLMYSVFDEVEYRPGEKSGNSVTMRVSRNHRRK